MGDSEGSWSLGWTWNMEHALGTEAAPCLGQPRLLEASHPGRQSREGPPTGPELMVEKTGSFQGIPAVSSCRSLNHSCQ